MLKQEFVNNIDKEKFENIIKNDNESYKGI